MPKNVQTYHSSLSQIVDRFKDYIKSNRDQKNNIADILPLMKLLLLDCKSLSLPKLAITDETFG